MNFAATIMRDVHAAGGNITVKNGMLKLSAPKPLPTALLDRVREAKPILLSALHPSATWDAADWQEFYDERAGVAEHDGGMDRAKAERMAYESCVVRWLNTNPPINTSEAICPHCHKPNGAPGNSCAPVLSGNGSHVWLHHACFDSWRLYRQQEAITALAEMGIYPPHADNLSNGNNNGDDNICHENH